MTQTKTWLQHRSMRRDKFVSKHCRDCQKPSAYHFCIAKCFEYLKSFKNVYTCYILHLDLHPFSHNHLNSRLTFCLLLRDFDAQPVWIKGGISLSELAVHYTRIANTFWFSVLATKNLSQDRLSLCGGNSPGHNVQPMWTTSTCHSLAGHFCVKTLLCNVLSIAQAIDTTFAPTRTYNAKRSS